MDFENRRVLVTGGAEGIGLAIARGFKDRGAAVYVTDLQKEAVAAAEDEGFLATVSDASHEQEVSDLMADVLSSMGGLDVLVNNVGIAGPTGPVEDCPGDDWQRTFEVNVHSQFYCVKHSLDMLRQGVRPSIINMSSAAGRLGMAGRSAYSASKWAVVGLTKTLAIELGAEGLRVNAICPGAVAGPRIDAVIEAKAAMLGRSVEDVEGLYRGQSSMGRMVEPKAIADTAVFLASDMAEMINGQAIAVDGHTEKLY
jgi:NAD(P)-dependent dehydrogenase (short-subunit alcohol dehydrogenase family)